MRDITLPTEVPSGKSDPCLIQKSTSFFQGVSMEPIPFIINSESGLVPTPEAMDLLKSIGKPIKAVSIAGTYRTGKSFLLNRLMDRMNGFPLGKTVHSKTKGIWIWIGDHPRDRSKALVLLDTEGLNDVEKGNKSHDIQIFTLAILLSSIFVYNCPNAIGADTLEGLELASELARDCMSTSDTTFKAEFIMALRDFQLDLSEYGSPNGYLEASLESEKGNDLDSGKSAIKDNFPWRTCFTFIPPVSFKRLKYLDQLKKEDLDPDFIETGEKFTDHVRRSEKFIPRKDGLNTGESYSQMAQQYVDLVNQKDFSVQGTKMDNLAESLTGKFLSEFRSFIDHMSYPSPWLELLELITDQELELRTKFTQALDADQSALSKFNRGVQELLDTAKASNETIARDMCHAILVEKISWVLEKHRTGGYHVASGLEDINADLESVLKSYNQHPDLKRIGRHVARMVRVAFWNKEVRQSLFSTYKEHTFSTLYIFLLRFNLS